jgi:hypothetical protein
MFWALEIPMKTGFTVFVFQAGLNLEPPVDSFSGLDCSAP